MMFITNIVAKKKIMDDNDLNMCKRTGEKLAPLSVNRIFLYQWLKQGCWCILWLFAQGLCTHQDQYKC